MARYRKCWWTSQLAGVDLPRRDRRSGRYDAYIPDALKGRAFGFDGDVAADVADADVAIARLDAHSIALTDTEALARLLLRAEAVASSRIEGLSVSPQRLLRADVERAEGVAVQDVTAREVLGNVDAMAYALSEAAAPISVKRILEVHRRLLAGTALSDQAGRLRAVQNWIGGNPYNPLSADFVPPPPEDVPQLLEDLAAFCNDDALPAVAQAAIAHAQFETIHPFIDGNGRTGRALMYMVLRSRKLATRTTPPISLVLATRSKDYVGALQATRYVGAATSHAAVAGVNRWVSVFAAACTRAVGDAEAFERRVEALLVEWRRRLGPTRSDSTALALLERLPSTPILTVSQAQALTGRSFPAVNTAIRALVDADILRQGGLARRNRTFEARELIEAFTALERQLASPHGNTRTSPPTRPVPSRPRRPTPRSKQLR